MMRFSGLRLIKMKAELLILLASVTWSLAQQEQLSQNIVTDEVRTEVIRTKYGRVQGFISRVGRDASSARYVQIFLGVPYASPPTGNYRSNTLLQIFVSPSHPNCLLQLYKAEHFKNYHGLCRS